MKNNLSEFRSINIYVDETKNMAVFPKSKNPSYNTENNSPMYILSKTFFELAFPYSRESVAELVKTGIISWDKYDPYTDSKKTIEEYYYNIKSFKSATHKKKLISLGWDDIEGKYVSLYIPMKKGKYYIEISSIKLHDEANWIEFADAVIELINMDMNKLNSFKIYKSKLNI